MGRKVHPGSRDIWEVGYQQDSTCAEVRACAVHAPMISTWLYMIHNFIVGKECGLL